MQNCPPCHFVEKRLHKSKTTDECHRFEEMRSFVRTIGPFTQSRRNWKAWEQGVSPPPLKKKRKKKEKKVDLPKGGFELQIFSNFPAHDMTFYGN